VREVVDYIAAPLRALALDIATLTPDPKNARKHDERNLLAIMSSLAAHGQVKPLVVRSEGRIVLAGNGTLEAAKRLGWPKLACVVVDLDAASAARYSLADNRSAELAEWDWAQLSETLRELGAVVVADLWSPKELELLLQDVWTPPAVPPDDGTAATGTRPALKPGEVTLMVQPDEVALSLTREEWEDATAALAALAEQYAEAGARSRAARRGDDATTQEEIARRAQALVRKIEAATAQETKP